MYKSTKSGSIKMYIIFIIYFIEQITERISKEFKQMEQMKIAIVEKRKLIRK